MKRATGWLALICMGLVLAGCEPEKHPDEDGPDFESWLQRRGLAPLNQRETGDLLTGITLYGRFGGGESRWIEYYNRSGVSVFQPDASQNPKRRIVYFGTWWVEEDRTCFSYPAQSLDCYRVYLDRNDVYFVRIEATVSYPAGSLAVVADEVRDGNSENYPFVED